MDITIAVIALLAALVAIFLITFTVPEGPNL